MAEVERKQSVQDILKDMRGLDGLKRLFWQELNYERENKPLSTRQWPESAKSALAEDPVLFASGGEDNAFHVVYCRLAPAELKRGCQRPIVDYLLRDHPYALFVFSNQAQTAWHFLNVKYDEQAEKRRLVRRIAVLPGDGLRTAAERLALLVRSDKSDTSDSPLAIQQRHDEAFDVEKVTKDFYRDIANWYFWALKHSSFPEGARKEDDGLDHISVIRLITRLIFCWFIREKGLIPDTLFERRRLAEWLDGFAPDTLADSASVFYRAILQNLFFATLNTEMDKRDWRREGQNLMAHNLYRYKACFRDPKSALALFKDIPFLNGGLFECLDRDFGEGAKPRYLRIDGFSDRADSQPTVPDYLFFGAEQDVDLSADYGDKKFKKVRVRGLIDTLNRYKFTIEENTPFDQEVALDPEMSGKVFENLLAAYNPETGTTARKATGSFYTPREIVDYMVDESLAVYLKDKLEPQTRANERESGGPATSVSAKSKKAAPECVTIENESRIRALLAYDASLPEFSEAETERLLDAIDNLKALDPAVGSGAFPMGLLHKLVHALGKLDPDNEKWKAKQIAKLDDAVMREEAERIFRDNTDNYGRKLFLIENCIYGVDIQPIAVQIAKMRFFISLIVDQKINPAAPNRGIRALPNLETKFVAANTLIGIEKKEVQGDLLTEDAAAHQKLRELRKRLTDVRHRHFTARTTASKAKCREQDRALRADMSALLGGAGLSAAWSRQLAAWDPYDQNASSPFFDPEWMFGVRDGFDVVIGNPPYGATMDTGMAGLLRNRYETIANSCDTFIMFIERAGTLLGSHGALSYIVPSAWVSTPSAGKLRGFFARVFKPVVFVTLPYDAFESAYVDTMIVVAQKMDTGVTWTTLPNKSIRLVVFPVRFSISREEDFLAFEKKGDLSLWTSPMEHGFPTMASQEEAALVAKLRQSDCTLDSVLDVMRGVETYNPVPSKGLVRPKLALTGDIHRYSIVDGPKAYIDYTIELEASKPWRFFSGPRILLRQLLSRKFRLQASYEARPYLTNQSVQCLVARDADVSLKSVLGVLNSRLLSWFFCQTNLVSRRDDFPKTIIKVTRSLPMPPEWKNARDDRLERLVTRILAAKASDPAADTSALEREIDEIVYRLYGLTEEEIRIVEGGQ